MNFGGWLPFQDAPTAAPEAPGVLQARAESLLAYPRGKTAMVLYAGCRSHQTLKRYLTAERGAAELARAAVHGARWIRFAASPDPDENLARLMDRFVERFGAPPVANRPNGNADI